MSDASPWPPPRQNPRLVGHEAAERTVLDAWSGGRMHHAWLITGPAGVGKATLAYRIARFVLAQAGEAGAGLFSGAAIAPASLEIAPDHPVSRQVASRGHPDLATVERSINPRTGRLRSEIVVEDVRRLSSFLGLTTASGTWRAVVVDGADDLNRSAANALLKALEEPPPRTLFLLVSNAPGRLLPTIRSRCRTLPLSPLDEQSVIELLSNFAADVGPDDARALARLAQGSVGNALRLAESGGLELYRELVRLLSGADSVDVQALHTLGDRMGRAGGEEAFTLLGHLLERWLVDMILGQVATVDVREIVEGEAQLARRLFARGGLAKWLEVWEKVSQLFSQASDANLDRKHVVVSAFLALEHAARG